MRNSNTIYEEVQHSRQPWLVALMVVMTVGVCFAAFAALILPAMKGGLVHPKPPYSTMSPTTAFAIGIAMIAFEVALSALLLLSNLVTEVRHDGLYIKYTPFHLSYRKISLENVARVEAVTYSPIAEYGGWGIRVGRNGRAYNPMGNRGARITHNNGKNVLIGSQNPEKLVEAIKTIMV